MVEVVRPVDRGQVPVPVRGERAAKAGRERQVDVVAVQHRDVAIREDRRHVRERIRIAEEIRALAVAVRVAAEGIDLEAVADRKRRVVHERRIVHRPVARLVRLRAGEREVGRRLLLEERDLVEAGAQRLLAVAVLAGQVQEAAADAEAGVDRREQRVAVVDALAGRLEVRAVLSPARRRLAALVRVLQHDVDDARNRIGAVLRARAVAQHFDPLDRADRNAVEVDRARALAELGFGREGRRRVAPLAVHEHEHLVRAQVPQLRRAHEVREVRVRLPRQVERGYERLQRRADFAGQRRGLANRIRRDEVDRREALVDVVARRARADDDDFFERRLVFSRERRTPEHETDTRRADTQNRPDCRP